MNICVVTFKECWQDNDGAFYSSGGFPMQMEGLNKIYPQMTIVGIKRPYKAGGIALPKNAKVILLEPEGGNGLTRLINFVVKLPYYIKNIKILIAKSDIVHSPLPGDISLVGLIIALIKKKKIIARYGGSWENNNQTTLAAKFTKFLMRRYAGGKRVMLATGMSDKPPAKNMHWIFSTTITEQDIHEVNANTERKLSEKPTFVYVGRLSPEKGVQILIEAVNIIKQQRPDLDFTVKIIGGGVYESPLKTLVDKYKLSSTFNFTGQLSKTELIPEIKKSDIGIQPSLTEGFSKAWLDEMICGLPVIASNVGAASQVVKPERGWLLEPGNVQQLVNTMIDVLTNESIDWFEMRKNAVSFVNELTLENWSKRILDICNEQWKDF